MRSDHLHEVVIAGAGIGGLTTALALNQVGIRTRRPLYMTHRGQTVWDEARGGPSLG